MAALVGFELAGGREAGRAFIDALQLFLPCRQHRRRALARHPSGLTTHSSSPRRSSSLTGVTPGYVRLSVGLEHPDDIIAESARRWTRRARRPEQPALKAA